MGYIHIMRRLLLLSFLVVISSASQSYSRTLIADLSDYNIEIDSDFTGAKLLLFGARNDMGDILVSVRGPQKRFIVRKKERIAGIWVNREQVVFNNVPQYQVFATTQHFNGMEALPLVTSLELGPEFISFASPNASLDPQKRAIFIKALLRHQHNEQLFAEQKGRVQFMGETLFKVPLTFPDNIPRGEYTAEVYLVSDGELRSMQSIPLSVYKSGMDAFLYDMAHDTPAIYGLLAVLIALITGWSVSYIFGRFNI